MVGVVVLRPLMRRRTAEGRGGREDGEGTGGIDIGREEYDVEEEKEEEEVGEGEGDVLVVEIVRGMRVGG